MGEQKIDAIYLESGSSHVLLYRHALEHQRAHVRPGDSASAANSPGFVPSLKRKRARELIKFGTDVRTWEERPESLIVAWRRLFATAASTGRIGMEEAGALLSLRGNSSRGSQARVCQRHSDHGRLFAMFQSAV